MAELSPVWDCHREWHSGDGVDTEHFLFGSSVLFWVLVPLKAQNHAGKLSYAGEHRLAHPRLVKACERIKVWSACG